MRAGATLDLLLCTKGCFVLHKNNRGESMIHKHGRLVMGL